MFTPPRRTVTAPASIDNSGLPQTTSPSPTAASNSRRQSTSLISALPANNKSKGANLAQTQDLTKDQEDIFLSFEPRPPRLLISEFKPSPEAEARVEFNQSFYEKNSWARFISQAKKYQIFDAPGDVEKSVEAYKEKFKEANSERHENYAKFYEFVTSKWGKINNEEQHEVLHLAISYNSTDILEFLFAQKIDVTSPDSNGIRPIHVAAARGNLAILKSLVKKGAKLNEPNAFGEAAWQIALNNNNKDVIPYLLEKSEDDEGNFPVHIATATCDTRMLGYLRDQGADFLKLNANNQTALQVAFRNERDDANETDQANKINTKKESINFFKELYSYFWGPLILKNETDKENLVKHMSHDERVQAVCIAANSNDQEMINILAEYKADIKSPDRHGDLPIHIAATYSTAHALFYLVQEEAKSSIKAQIEDGKTVLQTADVYNKTLNTLTINERDKRTVLQTADLHESEQVLAGFKQLYLAGNYNPQHDLDKDLLAKHMNPDERSKELHKALQQDDNVMVESLLRHGVAVNSRSGNYDLPIHIAIAKGDVNAVWRLVAVGADLNQLTLGGGSTLQIAEFYGKANVWACIKQLYLSGAYIPTHESDKSLLTKNMSTDERSYALHIALSQNDRAMMNSLFEYEINVNARDANGNLPIHLAVANDNVYAVQRLVAMGAELNDLAATEVTTLQIAEHGEKANVLDYIKQLYLNGSYVPKYDLDKDLLARSMGPDERSEALHSRP
ncbi:Ankyrin repeat protein [Mycoavidus cysteinexigens]|uniref:Ankyrin repeat protein n=1 Tax=Mycoavidus cysteinexigens TaxID=1553431 RepID=A0A2Z6EYD3_9BURK|nr:ankyrin repeat domain-containing protein [Mycoavidus cysteinexigens]BBE10402.1 Ankyrin repeat protein [Mycoavidus cysteinexigens]GLR00432.1 hypothetical protein GCM10007934_02430 [Mycoavidus cysteinexigens]